MANPLGRLVEIENVFLNMQRAIGYIPQGVAVAVE